MLRQTFLAVGIIAVIAAPEALLAQSATIERLETPADHTETEGMAVSADGGTVVGHSGPRFYTAARWQGVAYQDLGSLPTFDFRSDALGVSGNGSVVVGFVQGDDSPSRPFRWTVGGMELLPIGDGSTDSFAYDVSDDGLIIVGATPRSSQPGGACYWDSQGVHHLGTLSNAPTASSALAASANGRVIVGLSAGPNGFWRAFRWEAGVMEDLGSLRGPTGNSTAEAVSADGKIVVGESKVAALPTGEVAFRWTRETGMQQLPIPLHGFSAARDVSDDGRVIVGRTPFLTSTGGDACVWIDDAEARRLWDILEDDHGLDLAALGWLSLSEVTSCSADGRTLTGFGEYQGAEPDPVRTGSFRVTITLPNRAPIIRSGVVEGSTQIAAEEATFVRTFDGSDLDDGDRLTLEVEGLPPGATLTPLAGTSSIGTLQNPFRSTIRWTPQASDVGSLYDVTISYRDESGLVTSRSFSIATRPNEIPTVAPVAPVTIECVDGQHFVELSTIVADADDDPLKVTWKVDGIVAKTENVVSGATVAFGTDYSHGDHEVVVEASDGFVKGSAATTVAVEDTEDPIVVITPHVDLTTDPGKAFASTSRLTPPTVEDASGHPVTLESDAPEKLTLGAHRIVWTATDFDGNEVAATQNVKVVDREKPKIGSLPAIRIFCDPGKTYATLALKKPAATDNVPGTIAVTTTAGARFKIGTTKVVWVARDAARNVALRTQTVTVVNRKPKANAGRDVTVTTKSEKGAKVSLDGSRSSDPDKHSLKYKWTAKRVKLAGAASAKAAGVFPIGTTTTTLTVTDAAGAKHTDAVRVTVKLKNAKRRPRGAAANDAFSAATREALGAAAASRASADALRGLTFANAASGLGEATGEFVRWNDGESERDALFSYVELRRLQNVYGEAATSRLLSAYAQTGDEALLRAAFAAAQGTSYAGADLSE